MHNASDSQDLLENNSSRTKRTVSDYCDQYIQEKSKIIQKTLKNQSVNFINAKKELDTSVVLPYDKSQYLSSEYLFTFQQKWEWPASLEKAKEHELATSIGKISIFSIYFILIV